MTSAKEAARIAQAIHAAVQLEHGLGKTAILNTFIDLAEEIADVLKLDRADFVRCCAMPEW